MIEATKLYKKAKQYANLATIISISSLVWSTLSHVSPWFAVPFVIQITIATALVIKAKRLYKEGNRVANLD